MYSNAQNGKNDILKYPFQAKTMSRVWAIHGTLKYVSPAFYKKEKVWTYFLTMMLVQWSDTVVEGQFPKKAVTVWVTFKD